MIAGKSTYSCPSTYSCLNLYSQAAGTMLEDRKAVKRKVAKREYRKHVKSDNTTSAQIRKEEVSSTSRDQSRADSAVSITICSHEYRQWQHTIAGTDGSSDTAGTRASGIGMPPGSTCCQVSIPITVSEHPSL